MKETLRDLIRRVVSGSILVSSVGAPAGAAEPSPPERRTPLLSPETNTSVNADVVVVRERRPRLILKRAAETIVELISSHRSHRSHSSHRSHYSSTGGSSHRSHYSSAAPPRTTTPPRTPQPLISTPEREAGYALGSRTLVLGMRGADVMQLMRLLVVHRTLGTYNVNTDSLFTLQVEIAVRTFQRQHGLEEDGKVGPITTLMLKRLP